MSEEDELHQVMLNEARRIFTNEQEKSTENNIKLMYMMNVRALVQSAGLESKLDGQFIVGASAIFQFTVDKKDMTPALMEQIKNELTKVITKYIPNYEEMDCTNKTDDRTAELHDRKDGLD